MGRRESGFHRKAKRLLVEAGRSLGYECVPEKSYTIMNKRFQVDAAWIKQGSVKAVFEVERGFTWDSMHVLGHLVVLNAFASKLPSKLTCVFVFDENLRLQDGSSAHSGRLRRVWDWYTRMSGTGDNLDLWTLPIYWNRSCKLNTRTVSASALALELKTFLG
ncbi:MAG: hypothetical protein QW767_05735 [Thermoprotei archaeon]